MRKILLTILVILALTANVFVGATGNTQSPSMSLQPFIFTVTPADGSQVVLDPTSTAPTKLNFMVSGRNGKFSEDFIIEKIVNTSTNFAYNFNVSISKDEEAWVYTAEVKFKSTDAGKSIEFEIYWKNSAGQTLVEGAMINVYAPEPKIELKVNVDPASAVPGSLINLEYVIANTGNVPVRNILLKDETASSLNGETFSSDDFLGAGGSITKNTSIVLDGEISLAPEVSFTYNGKGYTVKAETVKIAAEEVIPVISLTCDNYSVSEKGAIHKFNYTITNTSQITLTDIHIYDGDTENANLVDGPLSLEVDQSFTGTYELPVNKSGYYKIKIRYTYDGADGEKELSAKTDKPLKLPNEVFMQIAEITPDVVTEPGKVNFKLLIENGTNYELRDLVISEESNLIDRVNLKNIIIPAMSDGKPGEYVYDVTVDIKQNNTPLIFNLSYTINGESSTINTTHDVVFSVPNAPTASPTPSSTPVAPIIEKDNDVLIWLILGVLLLLILLVLIIVLIVLKKRSNATNEPTKVKRRAQDSFGDDLDDIDPDDYDDEGYFIGGDDNLDDLSDQVSDQFSDEVDDEGVKLYKGKK